VRPDQRDRYAYAYLYFTYTVVFALVEGTPDFSTLSDELGLAMTLHGAIMVLAGVGFGWAVVRAQVLPRWTGIALARRCSLADRARAAAPPGPAAQRLREAARQSAPTRLVWRACAAQHQLPTAKRRHR
jgi:hypothetical protein